MEVALFCTSQPTSVCAEWSVIGYRMHRKSGYNLARHIDYEMRYTLDVIRVTEY